MPTWNRFDDQVFDTRRTIREYGGRNRYDSFPSVEPKTYKNQALLELATRLELDDRLKSVDRLLVCIDDLLDAESETDLKHHLESLKEARLRC